MMELLITRNQGIEGLFIARPNTQGNIKTLSLLINTSDMIYLRDYKIIN
jgi:hypothetical protein